MNKQQIIERSEELSEDLGYNPLEEVLQRARDEFKVHPEATLGELMSINNFRVAEILEEYIY
jgi:hypothetical protein